MKITGIHGTQHLGRGIQLTKAEPASPIESRSIFVFPDSSGPLDLDPTEALWTKQHQLGWSPITRGWTKLHWLDARAGFSRLTASAATAFSGAEAGHRFFTIT